MEGWVCLDFFLVVALVIAHTQEKHVPGEETQSYWLKQAQNNLNAHLNRKHNHNVAKNVIMFLGDGMGVSTVTAARIYKGQKNNKTGEEEQLEFEKFPYVSLSKTFAVDRQTSDSANTATAYLCGVKANYGTIGLDGRVSENDCNASKDKSTHAHSILQWAQDAGKATGFVTTTRVTHASPSGLYAHTASRNWESSAPDGCTDIATQLVNGAPGRDIKIIMGGGMREFLPNTVPDGKRKDGLNLTDSWLKDKAARGSKATLITTAQELKDSLKNDEDFLLGLFSPDHIPFVMDRKPQDPSLLDMVNVTIQKLQKYESGYFLFVEGGRIDHGHHLTKAKRALEEAVEMDNAVQLALQMTSEKDTMIVVTADHSHVFTISGYPKRGNNILGIGGISDVDYLTYNTLNYANGPGYKGERKRNFTEAETSADDFAQDTISPNLDETHGGEDVAVFANGPMAHLFSGVHDQTYIPYVMAYASCVGPNKVHCVQSQQYKDHGVAVAAMSLQTILALLVTVQWIPLHI